MPSLGQLIYFFSSLDFMIVNLNDKRFYWHDTSQIFLFLKVNIFIIHSDLSSHKYMLSSMKYFVNVHQDIGNHKYRNYPFLGMNYHEMK